jgi:hypothetical protein
VGVIGRTRLEKSRTKKTPPSRRSLRLSSVSPSTAKISCFMKKRRSAGGEEQ